MATIQIPNLPMAVAINGSEQLEAVQNGVSVRITTGQIALFAVTLFLGQQSTSASCSNRQMREALNAAGALVTIDGAVSADITNNVTIEWRNGSIIVNGDAVASFIQTTLGYTNMQMLALFASAITFPL